MSIYIAAVALAALAWLLFMREVRPGRTNVKREVRIELVFDFTPFIEAITRAQRSVVAIVGAQRELAKIIRTTRAAAERRAELFGVPVIEDEAAGDRLFLIDRDAIKLPDTKGEE